MKHTRKIIADDGIHKVEIVIKQDMNAEFDSYEVKNAFENFIDRIIKNVLLEKYHNSDIRVVKS